MISAKQSHNENFHAVLVGCPFKEHRLWNNSTKKWVTKSSCATVVKTYGDCVRMIWSIDQKHLICVQKLYPKYELRITALPVVVYQHYMKLIKEGKWNGIDTIPPELDY